VLCCRSPFTSSYYTRRSWLSAGEKNTRCFPEYAISTEYTVRVGIEVSGGFVAEFRSEAGFGRHPLQRPVQVLGQVWSIRSSTKYGVLRVRITTEVVSVRSKFSSNTEYGVSNTVRNTPHRYSVSILGIIGTGSLVLRSPTPAKHTHGIQASQPLRPSP
jgi:hypothetical protein